MMRKYVGGLLALSFLAASTPTAASTRSDAIGNLLSASSSRENLYSKEGRTALMSAVGTYCETLDAAVPRNRPAENEWLQGEITAGGNRAMAAISSKEFGRRRMLEFTENCSKIADRYISGQSHQRELFNMLYFWARFAPDAEQWAVASGVSASDWGFPILNSVIEALALSGAIAASEGIAQP